MGADAAGPRGLLIQPFTLARPRNRNRTERNGNRTFGGRAYSYSSFGRTDLANQSSPCESPLLLLARGQQRSSHGPLGRSGDPDLHPHGAPEPTVDISACLCSVGERRIDVVDPRPRAPATGSRPQALRTATRNRRPAALPTAQPAIRASRRNRMLRGEPLNGPLAVGEILHRPASTMRLSNVLALVAAAAGPYAATLASLESNTRASTRQR